MHTTKLMGKKQMKDSKRVAATFVSVDIGASAADEIATGKRWFNRNT